MSHYKRVVGHRMQIAVRPMRDGGRLSRLRCRDSWCLAPTTACRCTSRARIGGSLFIWDESWGWRVPVSAGTPSRCDGRDRSRIYCCGSRTTRAEDFWWLILVWYESWMKFLWFECIGSFYMIFWINKSIVIGGDAVLIRWYGWNRYLINLEFDRDMGGSFDGF